MKQTTTEENTMQDTESQFKVWDQEMIDCDGCGAWILTGDEIEIVDDDTGIYHFCYECR